MNMDQCAVALARTSSIASTSSDDTSSSFKRTRKRFSHAQLTLLEQLFHQSSHPTRDQREALATQAEIETRSVTIWFQNKRQTERKVALRNTTNYIRPQTLMAHSSLPNKPNPFHTLKPVKPAKSTNQNRRPSPLTRSLSLDEIASRSELRIYPPSTPTRRARPHPDSSIYENMLSSPIGSPSSPRKEYHYVEFGRIKGKRAKTLEWACASARLAVKQGQFGTFREEDEETVSSESKDDEETDEEVEEIITPNDSFGTGFPQANISTKINKDLDPDEDTMRAALALCGLGRW